MHDFLKMNPLIKPHEAQALIRKHLSTLPSIDCPTDQCAGRILREEVVADRPLPPFDRAMMDGYALRVADIPKVSAFKVAAQAPAGSLALFLDTAVGSCIEIMTGAVVPEGADCVVPYEETERLSDGSIRLTAPDEQTAGDAIHPLGSDHSSGEALIRAGRSMGGREVAIAATCGYTTLKVTKLPSIAIVSTGDELVAISETPAAHQIRRSNDLSIETTLALAGFPAQKRVHLIDEPSSATAAVADLIANHDIVLISGGISMGKKDFIPSALNENGLSCHFHGVAQKPGKPLGFWSHQSCAVFALPGNPLSTLTCLHHYVLPALHAASGGTKLPSPSVSLAEPAKGRPHLTVFLPVSLLENNQATPQPANNSGDLVSILKSDGYIELPASDHIYSVNTEFAFHPWY